MNWQERYVAYDPEHNLHITIGHDGKWNGWWFQALRLDTGYAFTALAGYATSELAKDAVDQWIENSYPKRASGRGTEAGR